MNHEHTNLAIDVHSFQEGVDSARAEWERRRQDRIRDLKQATNYAIHILAKQYKDEGGRQDPRIELLLHRVRRFRAQRDAFLKLSWFES